MTYKWTTAPLANVCEVKRGETITRAQTTTGMVPVIAGGLKPAYFHGMSNRPTGAITVSGSGANAGSVAMWEEEIWASDCSTVISKNPELSQKFVFYFLKANETFIKTELRQGAAQPHVYAKDLAVLEIPLPPLDEQKRLVAKLDSTMTMLDECSTRIDSQIIHAQLLVNSYKTQLFESIHLADKSTTLGQVAEKVVVGFVGTCSPFYTPDGVPFLRTQNVTKFGLDISQFQRISREFHLSNKKSQLLEGDVLLSRVITNDVNVGIVPRDLGEANCANVVIVRPGKKLLPEFLAAYISTKTAQKYLLDRKVGSAQVVVNTGVVKDWPIVAPSVQEQREIMDKLDSLLDMHQKRVAKLHEISKSLKSLRVCVLSAAFAGDF